MSARASQVRSRSQKNEKPDLRVVRRTSTHLIQRGRQRRLAPMTIVVSIAVVAALFGILLAQVVLAQSAFKVDRLRDRIDAAQVRHEELVFEVGKLASSARIERYARQELGMIDPENVQYIVANVGRTRGAEVAAVPPARPPSIDHDSTVTAGAAEESR